MRSSASRLMIIVAAISFHTFSFVACKSGSDGSTQSITSGWFTTTPAEYAAKMEELVDRAGSAAQETLEREMLDLVTTVYERGLLEKTIRFFVDRVQTNATPVERRETVERLLEVIGAELFMRGISTEGKRLDVLTWDMISARMNKLFPDPRFPPRVGGTPWLDQPMFARFLETQSGAGFVPSPVFDLLVDGPASFARRDQLIESARRHIYIASWAFYDDGTGHKYAQKLIAKARQGVDVRVMVDGRVSRRDLYDGSVRELIAAGIPVMRWSHALYPFHGMHRKFMVVDGVHLIAGGMNFGNFYSHYWTDAELAALSAAGKTPDNWRDTDVYVRGEVAKDALRAFIRHWNVSDASVRASVEPRWTGIEPAMVDQFPVANERVARPYRLQFIDHDPSNMRSDPIYRVTLAAIYGATRRIDINNAYYIDSPPLKRALLAALARGVEVRLITNSARSVDEPIIVEPILSSLPDLIDHGAKVWLKRGSTLHTKAITVDGLYGWIGSYNLHPRGYYYEGESAIGFLDARVGQTMERLFEADTGLSDRVSRRIDLVIPKSKSSRLASVFFRNQL